MHIYILWKPCALGIVAYTATNLDNLFVLLGFFANPHYRTREITLGQLLATLLLVLVSILASLISRVIEPRYVGLLGLAPMAIGARHLLRKDRSGHSNPSHTLRPQVKTASRVMIVVLATLANGGDNLGVYMPLFAVHQAVPIALMGCVFVLMAILWCAAARALVHHPILGAPIRRYGSRLLRLVLIGLGAVILARSGALALFFASLVTSSSGSSLLMSTITDEGSTPKELEPFREAGIRVIQVELKAGETTDPMAQVAGS